MLFLDENLGGYFVWFSHWSLMGLSILFDFGQECNFILMFLILI